MNENKRSQRNSSFIFNNEYRKESTHKFGEGQDNRIWWKGQKVLESWRNIILLYNRWDYRRSCRTYNTSLEKNNLLLQGRLWTYINSKILSIRHILEFQKKVSDRLDIKECQDILLFIHSVRKPLREYRKSISKTGDRSPISKND